MENGRGGGTRARERGDIERGRRSKGGEERASKREVRGREGGREGGSATESERRRACERARRGGGGSRDKLAMLQDLRSRVSS